MTWFWGLLMARALLETRTRSMDLDRVIMMCIYSVVLTFLLSLFLPYHVAMEWIVIGSMLLCLILIVVKLPVLALLQPGGSLLLFRMDPGTHWFWHLRADGYGLSAA